MPDMVRDGKGRGYLAGVDKKNRLQTRSVAESIQHNISVDNEEAYQCIGTATLAAATVVGLHIKNTSVTKNMIVTYIRHQIIDQSGGTAIPNASNYFRVALGRTYSATGSTATPVNIFSGSGNQAEVTAYQDDPTLTGTAREIDRWYTKSECDMNAFNKEGSVIIPPNQTIELSYVGDQTGGILYTRISFLLKEI
jgi:hypothetical protein